MDLVYQIFILFLIQSSLLVQTYNMLDLSPQRSKSHVNLETEFATEYPYLQHYTLISTYIPTLKGKSNTIRQKRHMLNTSKECHYLSLLINATTHTFCIFEENLVESDVAKKDTKIFVHGSGNTQTYSLEDLNITVARGYDVTESDAGSVDGYIEDSRFYGRVFVGSSTYYLEPVKKFPSILKKLNKSRDNTAFRKAILYEPKDAAFQSAFAANVDRVRLGTIDTNMPSSGSIVNMTQPIHLPVKPFSHHMFGGPEAVRGRMCEILLLADHLFLRDVANGNVSQAVAFMLRATDLANTVFRNADFDADGLPDNIGLSVKHVVVLTDEHTPQNHLRDMGDESVPIDGRLYLQHMATYGVLERVCIGAAFTSRRFLARALGLSYTAMNEVVSSDAPMLMGGICERPLQSGFNFNVLAITVTAEKGTRMPELTSSLSLAHELGHSFGSGHDPETGKCRDHLMSPTSLSGTTLSHYTFSECSKPKIRKVVAEKGFCLVRDTHAFCGNGLVEGDEECDCGLPLDCLQRDPCCNPRGSYRQCRVKNKFQCHPSQGPCCLPTCHFRDLSHVGLNCAQERDQCPCKGGSSHCSCGLLGECVGSQCHSAECVRLGLRECSCMSSTAGVCSTCCQAPSGECSSVLELTRQQVLQGGVSVASLRRLEPTPGGRLERVCDAGGDCANASFREWQRGNFCVSHGKLGHCSKLDVCDIARFRGAAFPRFEKIVESRAAFCTPTTLFGLRLISLILFTS